MPWRDHLKFCATNPVFQFNFFPQWITKQWKETHVHYHAMVQIIDTDRKVLGINIRGSMAHRNNVKRDAKNENNRLVDISGRSKETP